MSPIALPSRRPRRPGPPAGGRRLAALVRRTSARIAAIVAECRAAQRLVMRQAGSADRYLPCPTSAPDTYREFLFRTSGPLVHEPAASIRAAGRAVR